MGTRRSTLLLLRDRVGADVGISLRPCVSAVKKCRCATASASPLAQYFGTSTALFTVATQRRRDFVSIESGPWGHGAGP
jgi:hypothetical protein